MYLRDPKSRLTIKRDGKLVLKLRNGVELLDECVLNDIFTEIYHGCMQCSERSNWETQKCETLQGLMKHRKLPRAPQNGSEDSCERSVRNPQGRQAYRKNVLSAVENKEKIYAKGILKHFKSPRIAAGSEREVKTVSARTAKRSSQTSWARSEGNSFKPLSGKKTVPLLQIIEEKILAYSSSRKERFCKKGKNGKADIAASRIISLVKKFTERVAGDPISSASWKTNVAVSRGWLIEKANSEKIRFNTSIENNCPKVAVFCFIGDGRSVRKSILNRLRRSPTFLKVQCTVEIEFESHLEPTLTSEPT